MVVSASMSLSTASMSRPMVAGDLDEGHDRNEDDDPHGDASMINIAPKYRCSVDHDADLIS